MLVCEDDEMVLKMVEFKLQKEGHDVYLANDGKEAIEKIQSIEAGDHVILFVMDKRQLSKVNMLFQVGSSTL